MSLTTDRYIILARQPINDKTTVQNGVAMLWTREMDVHQALSEAGSGKTNALNSVTTLAITKKKGTL